MLMRVARAAGPAAAEPSHMLLNTVNERHGAFRRKRRVAAPMKYK
jgi:hypothetical protein